MKVLVYFENEKALRKSGIGRAMRHQMTSLSSAKQEFTIDPKDNFDMVHINTLYNKSYRLLKKCKKNNIPVIVHGHSTFEDFRDSFNFWKIAKIYFYHQIKVMYKNADVIITPTDYSKKLIESYGYDRLVYSCSNGIDLNEYAYSQEKIDAFKKAFNIKEGEKVIIGVGLLFQRKGLHDFVEIARSFPDIKFIWFGSLPYIARSRIIKKAMKNKPDNVIFPGYIANDIIKGAYLYSSCFLFPSYEETEGIVVLESLASKCATLVRDIGVYDGWLEDNKNCYKARNNEEFVNKIKYILENDNSKIIENGYEVVKERTLDKVGLKLKDIYEKTYKDFKEKN